MSQESPPIASSNALKPWSAGELSPAPGAGLAFSADHMPLEINGKPLSLREFEAKYAGSSMEGLFSVATPTGPVPLSTWRKQRSGQAGPKPKDPGPTPR